MYWRIWFEVYQDDKKIGAGVWHQNYKYKGNAVRAAKRQFDKGRVNKYNGKITRYNWIVSQTNPWRARPEQLSFMD